MDRVKADIQIIIEKKELFSPLANSSVLITGATGLIGSMLAKTLMAANETYGLKIKVIGQIRDPQKAKNIFGDQADKIEFVFTEEIPCDFIIHTVSPTTSQYFVKHPVEVIQVSVGRTMSILETARKNRAVMVYLSSMEQYGIPYKASEHMTEDKIGVINHLSIRSCYSESKRICECLCAAYASEYDVDVKIARLAQTFGAGVSLGDNRMPMQFARAAAEGNNIILHTEGKSIANFVYLTDAITGILTILEKGEVGQAYNVCNDKETRSVKEIAELVASEVAGGKIRVLIEEKKNMGYAPDVKMYLNSDKLCGLGWESKVSMLEAYERLVEYVMETEG